MPERQGRLPAVLALDDPLHPDLPRPKSTDQLRGFHAGVTDFGCSVGPPLRSEHVATAVSGRALAILPFPSGGIEGCAASLSCARCIRHSLRRINMSFYQIGKVVVAAGV